MLLNPFLSDGEAIYCLRFGNVYLGVGATGEWQLLSRGVVYSLLDERSMLHALPVLEEVDPQQLQDIEVMLSHALKVPVTPFPTSRLLHQALTGVVSDYWVEHALSWINRGAHLDERTAPDFSKLANNKSLSQGVRQKIKKLIRNA